MMKKLVLISLICVVSAVTMPVSADLISDADSAYVNDQFDRAVELYDRAVDSLGGSEFVAQITLHGLKHFFVEPLIIFIFQ